MSRREISIIVALMMVGFIAWEVVGRFDGDVRDEVAPGETPEVAGGLDEIPVTDLMQAYVPAVRASELHAAMLEQHELEALPDDAGLLAVVGNPGEYFFSRQLDGRGEVWIMKASGPELLWGTATDRLLELVGARGSELFLKFIDRPYEHPRDGWQQGGFFALDMLAPEEAARPIRIDDETIEMLRRNIR